jgi:hypothetical protein
MRVTGRRPFPYARQMTEPDAQPEVAAGPPLITRGLVAMAVAAVVLVLAGILLAAVVNVVALPSGAAAIGTLLGWFVVIILARRWMSRWPGRKRQIAIFAGAVAVWLGTSIAGVVYQQIAFSLMNGRAHPVHLASAPSDVLSEIGLVAVLVASVLGIYLGVSAANRRV